MAALNTLRTKGGVVLAVVIGLSLLAFLLGDLTNSSSTLFGAANMNVGIINGTKVTIQEYSNEVDRLTLVQQMLTGSETMGEQETESIRTQSWDKIIRSKIFDNDIKDLGLLVSEDEQLDMVNGEFISPVLGTIFVDQNTGGYDYTMVRNVISTIDYDPSGRTAAFWSYMEGEIADERALSKYFSLINNAMYITNAEASEYVKSVAETANVEIATKPTSSIADSLVTVTEADLKAYYDARKSQFKQVETRDIEYVVLEALPSESDYAQAKEQALDIAAEFAVAEDLAQFVNLNSNSPYNALYRSAAEMPSALATFAFSAKEGDVYGPALASDIYTIARVVDVKQLPDSLGAKHILLDPSNTQLADSLVAVLKKDKSKFAELASQFSLDQNANLSGGDLGLFPMNMMIPEFSNAIADSKVGEIIKVSTQFGTHIVEVTMISERMPKAQVAIVELAVDPSNQTSQEVYANATEFAAKASEKGADFDMIASDMGISKRVSRLAAGDRNIQGIASSAEVVRWVFDNKEGSVSPVISIGEQNIIARVASANDHGYLPFNKVVDQIRPAVLNNKKVEMLTAQVEGMTSIEEVAKAWDVEVSDAEGVSFRSYYIQGVGVAPKVVGAVSSLAVGQVSTPLDAAASVSVVKVVSKEPTEGVTLESEKALLEATSESSSQQRVMSAVYTKGDIRDMRIKFF